MSDGRDVGTAVWVARYDLSVTSGHPDAPTATLSRARVWTAVRAAVLVVAVVAALFAVGTAEGLTIQLLAVAVPTVAAVLYLLWQLDPAYILSAAICLSPFAGNWQYLHFPHGIDPDRFLLSFGILQVLLRAPAVRDRPRFRLAPVHVFLALALMYVVASAYVAGTLFAKDPLFKIVDAFGLLPFMAFLVAPLAFRTPRQRSVLLVSLVSLGIYLSLTTLFETIHLNALVFPRYILNPDLGIHFGRGRGPFLDAVANGFALFYCATASAVAARNWSRPRPRRLAVCVALLCLVASFLSLQRSVWIGVAAGTVIAILTTPWLRRYLVPIVAGAVIAFFASLALIPGLQQKVTSRADQASSVWDRENLTVAALHMVEARPLVGFGWQTFQSASPLYFRRSQNYPLTAVGYGVHNFLLTYAVELGLPGLALWTFGLLLGVGGAYLTRGPPEFDAWRAGLLAIGVAFLVIASSVPPSLFPNLAVWLWAGVVWRGNYLRQIDPFNGQSSYISASRLRPKAQLSASSSPQSGTGAR